jgi:hypothetical protein
MTGNAGTKTQQDKLKQQYKARQSTAFNFSKTRENVKQTGRTELKMNSDGERRFYKCILHLTFHMMH